MTITSAIDNPKLHPGIAAATLEMPATGAAGFAESLLAAGKPAGDDTDEKRAQVREAAQQFVASAFLKPMFAQVRNSPFKSDLMHGGQGEQMFGEQLDTHLADRMVQRMNFPLVDAVERYMLGSGQPKPQAGQGVNLHG